jgi:succinyl-CoA synthetase alpha subunit
MSAAFDLPLGAPVIAQGPDANTVARLLDSMRRYGTNIAGCVTPSTDGGFPDRLPRFHRFADAVAATNAAACVSLAAQRNAADVALEAAEAGVGLIVTLTPGVPVHDCLRARRPVEALGATWIGPATTGIARPSTRLMLGRIPEAALRPGDVALLTDCGSLGAEAGLRMSADAIGVSLFVDVGESPVKATNMAALLGPAATEPDTRAIVLLGSPATFADPSFLTTVQSVTGKKPILAYTPNGTLETPVLPAGTTRPDPAALAAAGVNLYNSLGALFAALKAST